MRIAFAVLAILFCLFLMQASARFGFVRLLSKYAVVANSIPAADQAVRLSPSDPDAHRARAAILNRLGMAAEASKSLESATNLRYRDDYLWLELGNAREEAGDTQGALAALDQAVHWAPYYAHTHWQRGNLLLRMGRTTEAFAELRQAAASNRTYLPSLIDLAWGISNANAQTAADLINVKSDNERLAFIRYLARKGKGTETREQMRLLTATPLSHEERNELAHLLFAAKAFRDAFDLWSDLPLRPPALFNGGFEEPLVLNQTEFGGWIVGPNLGKNKLAIDVSEKFAGAKSLQISFGGDWDPATPLLSQTVVVEPAKRYSLTFRIKTKDLATGGPLLMAVHDAGNNQLLGKSDNFPATDSWLTLHFEFTALATTQAAVIRLQRANCESSPCPIFGTLWLDEISVADETDKPLTSRLPTPGILSVETATRAGSVSLSRGEELVAAFAGDAGLSHSNTLLSDIDKLLTGAKTDLSEIDLFAVATGPGSFTGLRIGIATVKGLAATLNRPCIGVPTLHAVARSAGASPRSVALLPAGRGEVFAQLFSVTDEHEVKPLDDPVHISPQRLLEKYSSLETVLWCGEGAIAHHELLEQGPAWQVAPATPNLAAHVASLALTKFRENKLDRPDTLQAIYVRPSDAELKVS